MMKLYGSFTSPYVRRVRVACAEYGVPFELVDTMTEAGQAELRKNSPVWKVPAALLDGELIIDSHVILAVLTARFGKGQIEFPSALDVETMNLLNVVDTTLDSLIQAFYLKKDGVSEEIPYMKKQQARAASAFAYLEERLPARGERLTAFELALTTAIGWVVLRNACPLESFPKIRALVAELEKLPHFAATVPA